MVNYSLLKKLCLTVALAGTAIPTWAAQTPTPAEEKKETSKVETTQDGKSTAAKVGEKVVEVASDVAGRARAGIHAATAPSDQLDGKKDQASAGKDQAEKKEEKKEETKAEVKQDGDSKEVKKEETKEEKK